MSTLARFGCNLGWLVVMALVSGCAGGSGRHPTVTASPLPAGTDLANPATNAVQAPPVIYVSDFYLSPAMIQPAQGPGGRDGRVSRLRQDIKGLRGDDPAAQARKLVTTLGETIARDLGKAGYQAEYRPSAAGLRQEFFPVNEALPKEGWLLGGWFEQVQEGNRIEEATIGFGAGSGAVSIEVVVFDLAGDPRQPFLRIGSESAKHRMPGGLVIMNPYAMAAKFVLARGETERDVKKMGSAIAKSLVQFIQRGAGSGPQPGSRH
jgi:hypothetical protein